MLWAACCMCLFGFSRAGEVVVPSNSGFDPSDNLAYEDVQVDSMVTPHCLEVKIKASKTDPFCQGLLVYYVGVTARDL